MAIFTAIGGAILAGFQAVAAFVGSLGAFGQALLNLALGTALSLAANALLGGNRAPRFNNPSPQYQAVINQATAPRRRGYGRAKLGGVRAFFDSKGGNLYQVIMAHQGQIDAFEETYIGDTFVTTNGGGLVEQAPWGSFAPPTATVFFARIAGMNADLSHPAGTIASVTGAEEEPNPDPEISEPLPAEGPSGPYIKLGPSGEGSWGPAPDVLVSSFVTLFRRDGDPNQAADGMMTGAWPGVWTADHRLRGIAYISARFGSPPSERYLEVFPEGSNTPVRVVARLSRVLDTRTSVFAWSDNPALILMDYLTHPDGYRRMTYDDLDIVSFNAFANLCDEAVPLAAGGAEKRYRAWGVYELNDDPKDVVGRILATCDGELYTTQEGKLAIRGGRWDEPTVTIEARDILAHDLEEGADALDRFNQLKIVYTSPLHDFQPTEATPWDDLADQAVRGVQSQDFSVDMCPSPSQARRLAKIAIAKSNPRWRGTIRTNLVGLRARGRRTIRLVVPELDIDESFLVLAQSLTIDAGIPVGCELSVISLGASAYAWTTAEEGANPPQAQDTRPDPTFAVPEGVSLTIEDRGGTLVAVVTVTPPARADLQLEAQIRLDTSSAWEPMPVAAGSFEAVSGALVGGATYAVRVRFRSAGAAGPWAPEGTIPAVFSTSAPSAPTGFSSSQAAGVVTLNWTNPTTGFYRARVYRASGGSAVFADAVRIREIPGATTTDTPGAGTWRYWVAARNAAGFESAPAGPQTLTVT